MEKEDLRQILNWNHCKECGDCLVSCRYIKITRENAVKEIRKINKNEPSKILKKCISCYACNSFCPNDAHPYERIHYNWNERYVKKGLPARASYFMPDRRPNFRQDIRYSSQEKAVLMKWLTPDPPAKTVLYPGCNLLAMPMLAAGSIFEKLPVWGKWDLCCGEIYFRMGLLDPVKATAKRLTEYYRDKDIEEMIFVCPACYNMFTTILPQQFGAQFNFKTTFFTDWFMHELDTGNIKIKNKLSGSVVMHDSCHARIVGQDFMNRQRQLLERLGLTICESQLNKKNGLCCGIAAGCNKYSVTDIIKASIKELNALDKANGDNAAIYCAG